MLNWISYEKVLEPSQLRRLAQHKYNCEGRSLLEPLFQPFWNAVTARLPLWLAPNLMTMLGLIVNVLTTLLLVWYSPDGKSPVPSWCLVLSALGLFIYQTLDACDGKQARRTNSSSPLGELFDHGCDSVSTVFVSIGSCITMGYGNIPDYMFLQSFIAISLFYCAHWQTFVSGALNVGAFDVTEVQCIVIVIYLLTAFFGPQMWAIELPLIHTELRFVPFYVGLLCAVYVFVRQFRVILWGGAGKNGSSVAGTSVLSPSIPYGLVIVPAYCIFKKSESHIFEYNPTLYIIAFGIVAAKVTCRLIVAQMSKSKMKYTDYALFGPVCLFLNQYFSEFLPEVYVLYFCTLIACVDMVAYSHQVCRELCQHLKIELFRIKPVSGGEKRMTRSAAQR
ncbi:cholinephosphotransferase 1-like [Varroa jacobsoni]|uniref:diacylglycerol cholinephosphotransferase n=1 Tax=Varroa destructor TaxID=109461 RepID=A0A7M7KYH9_VARDE|nr:cholinephosphotransferase 1-like [Varroa destructor]XP_022685886.1 cholinephosphotransferase 1-like [Varroa jacobsoni]